MGGEKSASQAIMAITISNVSSWPASIRGVRLQQTTRILHLTERYISGIEQGYPSARVILPHAASYHGRAVRVKVSVHMKKEEFVIEVRSILLL